MKFYECPRCGFTSNIKTKYINHLMRKNICEPILCKTNLQKEYMKYDIKDKLNLTQNNSIKTSKNEGSLKITQNTSKINKCKYCDKVFIK